MKTVCRKIEQILYFLVYKLFKLKIDDNSFQTIMQIVLFCLVGFSNTVLGYLVYAGSLFIFRSFGLFASYDYFVSQVVMFLLSVLWSFYLNNNYVFGQQNNTKGSVLKALAKAYLTYAFSSLFLSEVLLYLWIEFFKINEFIAPILNLLITIPLNFILQKFWTFKTNC